MLPAAPAAASSTFSSASRYGALQRVFNDKFREWCWQRNAGTFYQVWKPPGVVLTRLKKDHWDHAKGRMPAWDDWGFPEPAPAMHLVLGALSGRWAVWQARKRQQEHWVVVDGDDVRFFQAFVRAMVAFRLEADEPDLQFPNLRLVYANERHGPRLFDPGVLRSIHVHLPLPARTTRPQRAPLVTPTFATDAANALSHLGELHLVTDDEAMMSEACGVLTGSRLFAPCSAFPFHEEKLPDTYPARSLLEREAATQGKREVAANQQASANQRAGMLYHSRWEKKPQHLPNFRFSG